MLSHEQRISLRFFRHDVLIELISRGLTDMTMEECEAKRSLMHGCREVFVLLDHTKINQYAPFVVCTPRDINMIITNSRTAANREKQAILQKCADDGVKLVYAAESGA